MKAVRTKLSLVLGCVAFTLLGATSVVARADGLVARASELAPAERAKLQAAVAEQRRADPKSFAAIGALKGHRPDTYRQFRNPIPQVGPELRHLGKSALLPMLEALVLDAPELKGATDRERAAVVEGMLTEVGRLRDPRAAAVLKAAFLSPRAEASAVRTAGRALGRLCDTDSRNELTSALKDGGRRLAAIDGLGECRSVDAANVLGAELDASVSKSDAASLARALGTLGSSWAWQALGSSRKAEGDHAREVAASALVRSYGRYDGDVRATHRSALAMIEAPETARIVTAHRRNVDDATAKELDAIVNAIASRTAH